MGLFKNKQEELTNKLVTVEGENLEISQELESIKESVIGKDEEITNLTNEKVTLSAEIETLKTSITNLGEELETAKVNKEEFNKETSDKAVELVSDLGHEPLEELNEDETGNKGQDLLEAFNTLTSEEKIKFYSSNSAEIKRAINQ